MSKTPTLDRIAEHGNRGHHHGWTDDSNGIVCKDGTKLSVIAGGGTYCFPRPAVCSCYIGGTLKLDPLPHEVACDYPGPYSEVEVYTDHPSLIPDYVGADGQCHAFEISVEKLREFIIEHGGEWSPGDAAAEILKEADDA